MTNDPAEQQDQPVQPGNVLMVVDDDVFDRLGSVVRHLCVGMMDEVIRVTVLSRSSRPTAHDAIGPSRLVCVRDRRWPRSRVDADEVLSLLDGHRPQIVHCMSADLARWACGWAGQWNSALVVHLTDLVDVRRLARLRSADGVAAIAATPSIQQALLKKRPTLAGQVHMVPLGLPAQAEPVCLDRPGRVPAVVVTTTLTRDCGLHLVLKAMAEIIKAGQEVHLFVLAAGPGERLFRRVAQQLNLRPYVTFAGRPPDWTTMREAIRGADFYILPTMRRRFTITTLTAMAAGLAVLAPAGTVGDYLIDGTTASLFDPQVPGELAQKWTGLLADQDGARQLAAGALDYIRNHHQASAMVSAVAGLYRELCQPQPAKAG